MEQNSATLNKQINEVEANIFITVAKNPRTM